MKKCMNEKIQIERNAKIPKYKHGKYRRKNTNCQSTNVTKYKCNKIKIEQNPKISKYKHDKIQKDKNQKGQD